MKRNKSYDPSFKISACELVVRSNRKIVDVARELGVVEQTLGKWVNQYRESGEKAFVGSGHLTEESKAEAELKKKIRELEEENAILKKAMRIFMK